MRQFYFQAVVMALLLAVAAGCRPNRNSDATHVETRHATSLQQPDTLFTPTGNAQLDSLLQLTVNAPQDTNLAKVHYDIAYIYLDSDFEKAKEHLIKLRDLSDRLDWNRGRYLFLISFPTALLREGLLDSALVVSRQGVKWAREVNSEEWIADMSAHAGQVYSHNEWHETALQHYLEALPYYERTNDSSKLALFYSLIGATYEAINLTEKAIEYGEKAYALNPEDLAVIYSLADAYSVAQQYGKAIRYCEEALSVSIQQNNRYAAGMFYFSLADSHLILFDLDRAEMYGHKALEIHKEMGNTVMSSFSLLLLGKLEALKGNFAQAEKYTKEVLQQLIEFDMTEAQRIGYFMLAELSLAQRNYRQNVYYWEKADSAQNVQAKVTTLRAAAEMEAKYETAKKDLEIENQKQVIRTHTLQRSLLIGGVAVSVVFVALLWLMLRLHNRRNQALTERNDLLAEMNTTKDKFFSIISNDLKNPATAQRDALRLLAEYAPTWSAERLSDYHKELLKSAEGQVDLIYNLLGWSQVQTGRITCSPRLFPVSSLADNLTLIRGLAEKKGVAFITRIPDGDATIVADSDILSAVVRNLLTNAVKYTHAGGTVTLEIQAPSNSPKGGGNPPPSEGLGEASLFTFSVTDTGIGMNAEQLNSLFRIDKSGSRRGTAGEQGTGLGLVVCKELLDKHGSALHVESEEGKGSRFWFTV
jgi:signal transduction histidine kinase